MKARHTDSILSSVLQHAISNISKLSGHGYDRFQYKYVPPPKRKGITAVIWGVLVLNFPQNHVLHTFQFVKHIKISNFQKSPYFHGGN